jgi:hypothetical protein
LKIFFLKEENRAGLINIVRLHDLGYKLCDNIQDLTLLQYHTLLYGSKFTAEENKNESNKDNINKSNSGAVTLEERQRERGITEEYKGIVKTRGDS